MPSGCSASTDRPRLRGKDRKKAFDAVTDGLLQTDGTHGACGCSSEVERQLPKLNVVGSIPTGRSNLLVQLRR